MAEIPYMFMVATGTVPDPMVTRVKIMAMAPLDMDAVDSISELLLNIEKELHAHDCRIDQLKDLRRVGSAARTIHTGRWEAMGPAAGSAAFPTRPILGICDTYLEAVQAVVRFLLPETRGVE